MTAFTLGEFARLTLLGMSLGVAVLAILVATFHLADWIGGDTYNAPVLFMARFGTLLICIVAADLLWHISMIDPWDWHNILIAIGLALIGVAYYTTARRWGDPRQRRTQKEEP